MGYDISDLHPDGAIESVEKERSRQDAKWGEQNHDPFLWMTVLMEEVGEAAQAALKARFGGAVVADYRAELVQVAAVAVAAIQCLDRRKWNWPPVNPDDIQ